MTEQQFIWISKWGDFQHYAPERDRAPAWIKTYTKQHDEDEYRALSGVQRAVLHDLRIAFARARGRLTRDTRAISQRIALRVTNATLEALNEAGYIEFLSRPNLDQRLDLLYASRARAHAHQQEVEEEREQENPPSYLPNLDTPTASNRLTAVADPDQDIDFDDTTATTGRKDG